MFTLSGSLQKVLNCFKKHQVSLSYIRSDRVPDDFARNRGNKFFAHKNGNFVVQFNLKTPEI